MSVVTSTEIERLIGFQILETEDGLEDYTLIFRIPSGEWACFADRQIGKYVLDVPESGDLGCGRVTGRS